MSEKKGLFGMLFGGKDSATEVAVQDAPQGVVRKERELLEITPAIIDNARLTLLDILKTMEFNVEVVSKEGRPNTITLEVTGTEDLGLVIGKEGSTLAALQLLVSNMLTRKYGKKAYVYIDANDYKAKQEEAIIAAANDAADVAEREGVQIVLDPMTAAERLLVHSLLQERPGVETCSRGEGRNRQVVVSPKGFKRNGGNN